MEGHSSKPRIGEWLSSYPHLAAVRVRRLQHGSSLWKLESGAGFSRRDAQGHYGVEEDGQPVSKEPTVTDGQIAELLDPQLLEAHVRNRVINRRSHPRLPLAI